MHTKLPLIICFFYCTAVQAQQNFTTSGVFTFDSRVPISDKYEIGPGQLTKDGSHFIVGLIQGNLEDQEDLVSNIYLIDPAHPETGITSFNLPSATDSVRYFQCSASRNEQIIVYVVNAYGGWSGNQLGTATKLSNGSYGQFRMLNEVNDTLLSDAYPWLSDDGLQLYYSQDFKLFNTSRSSATDPFNKPQQVAFAGDIQLEIVSCWLTPDQKNIFFIANNVIYKSTRKSISDKFSFPEVYTNEFKNFYFISGLSFRPNGKDLFLYYSDETSQSILQYHLTKGKAW